MTVRQPEDPAPAGPEPTRKPKHADHPVLDSGRLGLGWCVVSCTGDPRGSSLHPNSGSHTGRMSAPHRPDEDRVAVPALLIWDTPGRPPPRGPFLPPRRKHVRVLFTDGSWRPAEVLAWHPGRDILDDNRVWYVHLRLLIDGRGQVSERWYTYRKESFRPR
jgi:hypothetical protein